MQNQTSTSQSEKELFIKMVVSAWETQNKRLDDLLDKLPDEQIQSPVAPGRNRGIYLLGHLVAVNDAMLPILGFGEKLYPELEAIFLTNPDKAGLAMPTVTDLKKYWKEVNSTLTDHFTKMEPGDWFAKHTSVSAEDFAKEPQRNKLNILISRANHQSYHLGQLAFLK